MNVTQHGYADDQKKIIARLNRIEGQVRGIRQMTEDGEYCIDILTQISAANSALKSVALLLLDDHLNHCVRQATQEGGTVPDEKLAEVSAAIARLVKS
ncbi:metal-sensitive transcriptional regulator [Bifidobacterium moukalabense]|uniref:metal-sensitive transcriptional regulator n=1 Tax=Bifidobacterium moukalabense TaxID=1333651 RepID=UPI0010F67565|nr:metal-sensitive transcriptional regulator [Bifidobacterium moukalabense]